MYYSCPLVVDLWGLDMINSRLFPLDLVVRTHLRRFIHGVQRHIHPGRVSQSDLSERPTEVTPSQSDQPERPAQVTRVLTPTQEQLKFVGNSKQEDPLAVNEVEGLEGQEELCFINNNGSWYKKEPNFQYNNYQQKSYPNNQQSGYPPRNNQQGSYQPQQNPSSGSSAPQESSTDTLLKQILESQTRSEKHVGYELKNLHSKIDGSYNELNNKFSHLASTVFEYHMEFLETFGCIWSSKEVIRVVFGRALPGATSRSDYMRSLCTTSRSDSSRATAQGRSRFHVWRHTFTPRSDLPERRAEVAPEAWSDLSRATGRSRSRFHHSETRERARSDLPERHHEVARISHPSRSDLPKRHPEVARVSMARRHEAKPGATSQSDPLRSLPKAGATCRSDMPRSLRAYYLLDFYFT
uniref:Uncharacterized protein n=3 Tax=Brassica campestris TaxID=3711 RepID=M4EHC5_BRACM